MKGLGPKTKNTAIVLTLGDLALYANSGIHPVNQGRIPDVSDLYLATLANKTLNTGILSSYNVKRDILRSNTKVITDGGHP